MRFMLIHLHDPLIDFESDEPVRGHCFGPYDSYEDAVAANAAAPDDCYKVALPIVGPDGADVDAVMAFEAAHGTDWTIGPQIVPEPGLVN